MVKGKWPGVKMGRNAGAAAAGPTGVPWVDSNGWSVRLAAALKPEAAIWVDAPPAAGSFITADSYLIAAADTAAYGGRWILSLDEKLAAGIATQQADAMKSWKRIADSAAFFAARKSWTGYAPVAVAGVVSDFSGKNEFFSGELLNLLARTGQHVRILPKDKTSGTSFEGLRAVIYTDGEAPSEALRKQIAAFVQAGGMLITGPNWGPAGSNGVISEAAPAFSVYSLGKGKIAQSGAAASDPYQWANDSAVLVSHRYDLVRFWNGGATGSYIAVSPDKKQTVAHLLFYANRGPDSATVRIAGKYRSVKAWTVDNGVAANVQMEPRNGGVEVRLPQVSQYVALELEM